MNVLIVHDEVCPEAGARPDETDAITQAHAVAHALRELGHEPSTLGVTLDLQGTVARIRSAAPDVVFNIVESLGGHGRLIHILPGVLEALGIPFTGASSQAQFSTSNKLVAKQLMHGAAVRTPAWFTLDQLNDDAHIAPGSYIIKSVWEHASIGLDEDSIVQIRETADDRSSLRNAIESRLDQLGGEAFAEQFIDGREFNLALLANRDSTSGEPQVLPPAEIVFDGYDDAKPKVVGWRAKWEEDSFEYHHTPRKYDFPSADAELIERLRSIALQCWQLFDLRGHARVDFRADHNGRPWVLEVNTNPCLSPDAGFAAALEQSRVPFAAAIDRVLCDVRRPAHASVS
jgi:D-alanine-D-alanine ligase